MSNARILLLAAALSAIMAAPVASQPPVGGNRTKPAPVAPRLVPVAETKLLMEGITHSNFQGLEKILRSREIDAETWGFAKGQAMLVAESGNLLMLRPPRNSGQEAWMRYAAELRDAAADLAKTVATHDLERSRAGLTQLAGTCNQCHQTFRVSTRIRPFAPEPP